MFKIPLGKTNICAKSLISMAKNLISLNYKETETVAVDTYLVLYWDKGIQSCFGYFRPNKKI